ncbi:MAG TPA: exodeoxyribonuclease VII small subunit [Bacteroidaceae bacterium]|jgi:exodeoxyribonuclease VII small subunit|nr:exodeoxyribonuclease VII small subunit [Bacteroidaceae bacterium]OPZ44528.1 MAG: exodeoxyribonuclease VII small subunit [Bacteroidetes bacterium ADurb.BinA104]MBP8602414.1 exodeoxyribonuclease VII small subunit [Bacteroidaceae bacterium]HOD68505.1 exodeoxyribonuclease VII small subunit [Bacteroidaceae bacterium]HPB04005.1 exodeoxyribonuclease VII small subunit [Bacteroidaceae bacterium]
MKYEEAMKRLEEIVSKIEENKLDIDQIGDSLREARELIKFCKERLYKTNEEIKKILEVEE